MRTEGNRKNREITHGCAMKRRRCSAIFVRNLRRQTSLHQQKGVQISVPLKMKMSPKILAKGTNCPLLILRCRKQLFLKIFYPVAPDTIHNHVKTYRDERRNMHFIAPEYGMYCRCVK